MDEEVQKRIEASFARQGAMQTIGADLTRISHKMVEIELAFHDKLTQQHGFLHAGVVAAVADSAGAAARTGCRSLTAMGQMCVSVGQHFK